MIAAPHPGEVASSGGTPLDLAHLMAKRHPVIMGVLNVTPDSFSDGGRFLDPGAAIAHAKEMIGEGADIIDIGAESSRPYDNPVAVTAEEERRRLEGVLPAVARLGHPVSIDTMKASVAAWALRNGASHRQRRMGAAARPRHGGRRRRPRRRRSSSCITATRPIPTSTSSPTSMPSSSARSPSPPPPEFAATPSCSTPASASERRRSRASPCIARLDRLEKFGLPVLVGASRKRFIHWVAPAPPQRRLGGSIAAHILAVENGAAFIRTHDVAETVQAMRVMAAIRSRA